MTYRLPLFPLGMVLLPGLVLPLHIFEERYRLMIGELLDLPEDQQRFGVLAIREGREVGADGVRALHEIGCTAQLRQVHRHEDGRFELVSSGVDRFRLARLDDSGPYLTGDVEFLPDDLGEGDEAPLLDRAVRAAFGAYLTALGRAGGEDLESPELPEDSLVLGYLVASAVQVDLADRQALLAEPDGTARLRAELHLLRRETTLLGVLSAAPSSALTRGPISPN